MHSNNMRTARSIRGSLSRGVSVWGSLSGGLYPGSLCLEVSVQGGVSVRETRLDGT